MNGPEKSFYTHFLCSNVNQCQKKKILWEINSHANIVRNNNLYYKIKDITVIKNIGSYPFHFLLKQYHFKSLKHEFRHYNVYFVHIMHKNDVFFAF